MFRYVGFVWDPSHPKDAAHALHLSERLCRSSGEWQIAAASSRLRVLCAGERPGCAQRISLHANAGVLLGALFARSLSNNSTSPILALGQSETRKIVETGGRALIRSWWGRYVAFIEDEGGGKVWVAREPLGGLPCFHVRSAGVSIYFSWLPDIREALSVRCEVNLTEFLNRLVLHTVVSERTCIDGIEEIQPGECVEHAVARRTKAFYWSPRQIAGDDLIEDEDVAVRALRDTAQACVARWTSRYERVLITLSGGFDSSILLACLARSDTRPEVVALNYYSPRAQEDERQFARLIASRYGIELIERERLPLLRVERALSARCGPNPDSLVFYLSSDLERQICAERGIGAIFNGAGGDQLFVNSNLALTAADRLQRLGWSTDTLRYMLDVAGSAGVSLWQVLWLAIQHGVMRMPFDMYSGSERLRALVNRELYAKLWPTRRWEQPVLRQEGPHLPPAKLWQAIGICMPYAYYNPIGVPDDPELVPAFWSQPLIELCLRVPTDLLTPRGRPRGLMRRAFQDLVPGPVIDRRWKGKWDDTIQAALWRNNEVVRPVLLDGWLSRERLIDRARLEAVLSGQATSYGYITEIFHLLCLEIWISNLRSTAPQMSHADGTNAMPSITAG